VLLLEFGFCLKHRQFCPLPCTVRPYLSLVVCPSYVGLFSGSLFLGCCSVQRRANSAAFLGKPTNTPMHTKQNQPNSSHPHATNHATNHSQHLLCDGCVAQATLYQSFWSVGLNFCPAGQDQLTKGRMDLGVECKIRSSCCELSVGWLRDPTIPNQPNQPASQPSNQEAEQATNQTTNQGTNQPNNHPTIQTDESFHPAQLY